MNLSSSRLTAIYLTQEGMEIVRNIRDTNWLEGALWNDGLGIGIFEVDYDDSSLSVYGGGNYLKIDNGFYNYSNGDQTKFQRKITIENTDCPDGNCISVYVETSWQQLGKTHNVVAVEHLYDWYSGQN